MTADYAKGDVVGLGKYKRRLITALASGVVKIWSKKDEVVINTGAELDALKSCEENRSVFATGGYLQSYLKGNSLIVFCEERYDCLCVAL